jgi:hypothetical protein
LRVFVQKIGAFFCKEEGSEPQADTNDQIHECESLSELVALKAKYERYWKRGDFQVAIEGNTFKEILREVQVCQVLVQELGIPGNNPTEVVSLLVEELRTLRAFRNMVALYLPEEREFEKELEVV